MFDFKAFFHKKRIQQDAHGTQAEDTGSSPDGSAVPSEQQRSPEEEEEARRIDEQYRRCIEELDQATQSVAKCISESESLKESQKILWTKHAEFNTYVADIQRLLKLSDKTVKDSKKKLNRFADDLNRFKKSTLKSKETIPPLLRQNEEYKSQVLKLQEDLIFQLKNRTDEPEGIQQRGDLKFQTFYKQIRDIEKLLNSVISQRDSLVQEVTILSRKAKSFKKGKTDIETRKSIEDLQLTLDSVQAKKKVYDENMMRLSVIFGL